MLSFARCGFFKEHLYIGSIVQHSCERVLNGTDRKATTLDSNPALSPVCRDNKYSFVINEWE